MKITKYKNGKIRCTLESEDKKDNIVNVDNCVNEFFWKDLYLEFNEENGSECITDTNTGKVYIPYYWCYLSDIQSMLNYLFTNTNSVILYPEN